MENLTPTRACAMVAHARWIDVYTLKEGKGKEEGEGEKLNMVDDKSYTWSKILNSLDYYLSLPQLMPMKCFNLYFTLVILVIAVTMPKETLIEDPAFTKEADM